MTNIMNKTDPRWRKFIDMLSKAIERNGCDATTLTQSKKILKEHFSDIDIEGTVEYFEGRGGFCDCEVIYNVDRI